MSTWFNPASVKQLLDMREPLWKQLKHDVQQAIVRGEIPEGYEWLLNRVPMHVEFSLFVEKVEQSRATMMREQRKQRRREYMRTYMRERRQSKQSSQSEVSNGSKETPGPASDGLAGEGQGVGERVETGSVAEQASGGSDS